MLSEEYLNNISKPLIELYAELETELVENIAKSISETNLLTASAEWEFEKLEQMNLLNKQNIRAISKASKKTKKEVQKLVEQSGFKVLEHDEKTYREALRTGQLTIEPVPLNLSPALRNILNASIVNSLYSFNLTNTTALTSSQNIFYNSVNKAYLEVANGIKSTNQAVKDSVKELSSKGITGAKYPTRSDHIDVVVRRNIITTIAQTTGKLVEARAKEWGSNLVEVSSHAGARPDHAEWQGDIYMLEGSSSKYANLEDVTGYGRVDGLCGANCKHQFFAYVEGVSEPVYEKYDKEENDRIYKESQQQRKIERDIRKYKREQAGLEAAGQDSSEAKAKVKEKQKEMREFIDSTNRTRRPAREQIYEINKIQSSKPFDFDKNLKSYIEILGNSKGPNGHIEALQYYADTTDYILNNSMTGAYAYIPSKDEIRYNPNALSFEEYDFNFAITHELTHRADILRYKSYEDENFKKAIEICTQKVDNKLKEIEAWFAVGGKYEKDMGFSDIMSALTNRNDILPTGHPDKYWKEDNKKELEIFANISAIDVLGLESKKEFDGVLKEIYEAYLDIVGGSK